MLHQMERPNIKKKTKRLGKGQGSGYGHQASKGHKGTKARSGGKVPVSFEGGQMPLQRRLPKRGFKNIFRIEFRIVDLEQIQNSENNVFDIEVFEDTKMIRSEGKYRLRPVKILSNGIESFNKKVTIKANAFSEKAKEAIEKLGGTAEVL
ncbi:MAG TPA: 50S ribosomal protein L15 [Candidatus Cloacimonadota bacterium]|nr:50S ribosomal protein L15 [Candidatus Cloacimonadota bacterium]HOQ79688.1 50S ribosomal protein L15 [Candidatus Cloacimonadota bacterium]HPK40185.1 50S ribosomal protein L15 [Candidatus Cloacimonadota bacterium]HPY96920.1 50S ribosomal protein L15 [Candidatus Cloacimonadota bacterium]HQB40451.1 50S ribosomal protein L15 [Candidatus Cloacimonadota bacterium]